MQKNGLITSRFLPYYSCTIPCRVGEIMIALSLSLHEEDTVLVFGGGAVAERRIGAFLAEPARIVVISPAVTPVIEQWVQEGKLMWLSKLGETADIEEFHPILVLLCTDNPSVNAHLQGVAREARILTNRSDDLHTSQVMFPSVVTLGDVRLAISAGGAGPFINRLVRQDLEKRYALLPAVLPEIMQMRQTVKALLPTAKERQQFWRTHFTAHTLEAILQGDWSTEREILKHAISDLRAQP